MREYGKNLTPYGQKIKEICKIRGIRVKDLAEKVGISDVAMSYILNGKNSSASVRTLERLATALGVKVGDFFDSTGILHPQNHLAPGQFLCPKCGSVLEVRVSALPGTDDAQDETQESE